MIDLKELEKMVDESLEHETKDSLIKFLENERKKESDYFLGEGSYNLLDEKDSRLNLDDNKLKNSVICDNDDIPKNDYSKAA